MSVVALPVARISVGPYWLRPPSPVVFLVGKAETGPDQNHLHLGKRKPKKQNTVSENSDSELCSSS